MQPNNFAEYAPFYAAGNSCPRVPLGLLAHGGLQVDARRSFASLN
jgi:hypothetical protein